MYKKIVLLTLLNCQIIFAALPPRFQNLKDLDVMIDYIHSHEEVLTKLVSIDFRAHTIYYNVDCKIVFKRATAFHLPGWVGPAEPLEFEYQKCNK